MDTDSFVYDIQTKDVYDDMLDNLDMFDTSDYPKGHKCHSEKHKKIIGKFKDEENGTIIKAFCALKSKMYSIQTADKTHDKKIAKGVAKIAVKHDLTHEDYMDTLTNKTITYHSAHKLNVRNHQIYTSIVKKKGLSAADSKRVVLANGIDTLPFGHYLLRDKEWCKKNLAPIIEE